jgi:DNA polymerase-3 subunit gamma/tau
MIPTIVSRCQRFDFKRLQVSEIIEKLEFILKKEGVKFEASALSLIALNARGSFRDAESLLDKCINFSGGALKTADIKELLGIVEVSQISAFVDLLLGRDAKGAMVYIDALVKGGVDLQEFAKTLIFYLRQALLSKIDPAFLETQGAGLSKEEIEILKRQTSATSEKNIQTMLELFIQAENNMKYAVILQLPLELAVVDIINPEASV